MKYGRKAALAAALLAPTAAVAQAAASPYTSAARYDAVGRVTGTISADPDPGSGPGQASGPLPFLAVRNSYSPSGDLTKVETGTLGAWQSESVAPAAWSGFTVNRTAESLYDAMGRKLRDTVREGAAGPVRSMTQTSYDAFGRPDCTAVRMNPADFAAPPASACTQGTGGADRITRNAYDAAGQRLQLRVGVGTSVEGTQATWAYDLNGQPVTVIDGNGNRAELHYDGHGRQDRWTFPSTTRAASFNDSTPATALASAGAVNAADYEAYSYDANGNRTNLRKRDGRNIALAYDALNRVTSKTYPQGGATAVFYGYDLRNLQLFARFGGPAGEGVTSTYDGFGRLASSSLLMDGTARTLGYAWDANSNRTRLVHPDGPAFATLYDGLNRPVWMGTEGVNGIASVVYLPHGALLALNRLGSSLAFDYDGVQRQVVRGFLFPAAASNVTWVHSYNPAGGIAAETRYGDDYAWTGAYNAARPYATNGLNQYATTGPPNTPGSVAFTYDPNGNLATEAMWNGTAYVVSATYTYDIENRLVGRTGGVTLRYDPLGRLYEVTGNGNTTRFLYDGDALVAEYDMAGAMLRRHAHWPGADVPMTTYEGSGFGTVRQLFPDRQGSIAAIADHNGARLAVNTFDEYGIPGASNSGRFQYTGQIWLAELGMYHYKARLYSPTLGRFLQTDPVGYQDQFNLYTYVGNDPVNRGDPTGTDTVYNFPGLKIILVPIVNMSEIPDRELLNNLRVDGVDSNNVRIQVRAYISRERESVSVTTDRSLNNADPTGARRSHTDIIGGREIRLAPGSGARPQKHEFVHTLGGGDQYAGGQNARNQTLQRDVPGSQGSLMGRGGGLRPNRQTIDEISRHASASPRNTQITCSAGDHISC
jgi:RHS repeat-associated protein